MRRAKPGDRVLVGQVHFRAIVESVEEQPTGDVKILLDWGEHGKSRVWEHDYGTIWVFLDQLN